MAKVIVTGANGFVGRYLVDELLRNNYQVIPIGGPSDKLSSISFDLVKRSEVSNINFFGVDYVVHLAGLAAIGPSFENPERYIKTNMVAEINIFEETLRQNVSPLFLIISSGNVYEPFAVSPITEKTYAKPTSPYAVSKLGQELLAYYYSLRGLRCIIARPFNHFGPGQDLGFIVPDLVKQIVEVERGNEKDIKVGNLDAKRDYSDVRDIVRAYRLLLEKGRPGEIYNVCSGKARSGQEILDTIMLTSGIRVLAKKDLAKIRPSDTPEIYGSHQKITDDTGWQTEISFKSTIKDVLAEWRSKR